MSLSSLYTRFKSLVIPINISRAVSLLRDSRQEPVILRLL